MEFSSEVKILYFDIQFPFGPTKGYAAKRTWFTNQKVDYGSYEEGNQRVQHEMELVRQQTEEQAGGYQQVSLHDTPQPQAPSEQSRAANPFQQKASNPFQGASNPFNN